MGLDTADDLFYLASDLHLGAQQLLGFLYCLTGNDLTYLELQFCKIIVSDLRFCLDVLLSSLLLEPLQHALPQLFP